MEKNYGFPGNVIYTWWFFHIYGSLQEGNNHPEVDRTRIVQNFKTIPILVTCFEKSIWVERYHMPWLKFSYFTLMSQAARSFCLLSYIELYYVQVSSQMQRGSMSCTGSRVDG